MIVNNKLGKISNIVDNYYSSLFVVDNRQVNKLGELVKKIRNDKGLSVKDVSLRSGGEISSAYVNKIENEPMNPTTPKLVALAKGLGITQEEIFAAVRSSPLNITTVVDEKFENLSLKFSGMPSSKKERAQALIDLMDRELDRINNEK